LNLNNASGVCRDLNSTSFENREFLYRTTKKDLTVLTNWKGMFYFEFLQKGNFLEFIFVQAK
jgi:hypothetical protein